MARHMADDRHTFRAVVNETTARGGGEPMTYTRIYGPYRTKGAAAAMISRAAKAADRNNAHYSRMIQLGHFHESSRQVTTVTGRVEQAATVWTAVDQ